MSLLSTNRVKIISKYFYTLAAIKKKETAVDKSHAERLEKYWGCLIKQLMFDN